MADKETLDVYAREAGNYVKKFGGSGLGPYLKRFLSNLPKGGHVLDLGCGPGTAAAAMIAEGFKVDAWDASPAFAEAGRETYGVEITVAEFGDLTALDRYDGIYANFSLLHAPKAEMPGHLARIAAALKPGGRFHIGLKAGSGEKRDKLGRRYAYYEMEELVSLLRAEGLEPDFHKTGAEAGLAGTVEPWIILHAGKNG